jgi:hypothetical protein
MFKERIRKMIRIEQHIEFETYDQAFDFISGMDGEVEEGSLFYLPLKTGNNWSFVTYPPERVNQLCQFDPLAEPSLRKAYDEQLGLLELCSGDYANPRYIALTPDVDVQGLKKQWLQKYCKAHGLAIEDCQEREAPTGAAFEDALEEALRQAAGKAPAEERSGGKDGQAHQ